MLPTSFTIPSATPTNRRQTEELWFVELRLAVLPTSFTIPLATTTNRCQTEELRFVELRLAVLPTSFANPSATTTNRRQTEELWFVELRLAVLLTSFTIPLATTTNRRQTEELWFVELRLAVKSTRRRLLNDLWVSFSSLFSATLSARTNFAIPLVVQPLAYFSLRLFEQNSWTAHFNALRYWIQVLTSAIG